MKYCIEQLCKKHIAIMPSKSKRQRPGRKTTGRKRKTSTGKNSPKRKTSSRRSRGNGRCVKQLSTQYNKSERQSPPFIAKDCVGQVRTGWNGEKWVPVKTSRGLWRWERATIGRAVKVLGKRPHVVVPAPRYLQGQVQKKKETNRNSPIKPRAPLPRGCAKQSTKKYTSRISPPYPANQCCGATKTGNDGRMWVSKANKTGNCRWVPA